MAEPSWEQATPADLRKLVGELDEAASDQVLGWLGRDRGFALNVWELDRDPALPGHVVVSQDLVAHESLRCRVEELVAVLPPARRVRATGLGS